MSTPPTFEISIRWLKSEVSRSLVDNPNPATGETCVQKIQNLFLKFFRLWAFALFPENPEETAKLFPIRVSLYCSPAKDLRAALNQYFQKVVANSRRFSTLTERDSFWVQNLTETHFYFDREVLPGLSFFAKDLHLQEEFAETLSILEQNSDPGVQNALERSVRKLLASPSREHLTKSLACFSRKTKHLLPFASSPKSVEARVSDVFLEIFKEELGSVEVQVRESESFSEETYAKTGNLNTCFSLVERYPESQSIRERLEALVNRITPQFRDYLSEKIRDFYARTHPMDPNALQRALQEVEKQKQLFIGLFGALSNNSHLANLDYLIGQIQKQIQTARFISTREALASPDSEG